MQMDAGVVTLRGREPATLANAVVVNATKARMPVPLIKFSFALNFWAAAKPVNHQCFQNSKLLPLQPLSKEALTTDAMVQVRILISFFFIFYFRLIRFRS